MLSLHVWLLSFGLTDFVGIDQAENDPTKLSAFFNKHVAELAVLKRSAIVNQLYGGWRLVVEQDKPGHVLERADS